MKFIVGTSKVKIGSGWTEFTIKYNGKDYELYMDGTPAEYGFKSLEEVYRAAVQLAEDLQSEVE